MRSYPPGTTLPAPIPCDPPMQCCPPEPRRTLRLPPRAWGGWVGVGVPLVEPNEQNTAVHAVFFGVLGDNTAVHAVLIHFKA